MKKYKITIVYELETDLNVLEACERTIKGHKSKEIVLKIKTANIEM